MKHFSGLQLLECKTERMSVMPVIENENDYKQRKSNRNQRRPDGTRRFRKHLIHDKKCDNCKKKCNHGHTKKVWTIPNTVRCANTGLTHFQSETSKTDSPLKASQDWRVNLKYIPQER